MNYIVFDLEWNQGKLGKKDRHHQKIPFEIIEIGAVKLNEKKEITDKFDQLVKPQIYKDMPHMIEKMLHVDMQELAKGNYFQKVCNDFLKWTESDSIFCTWGNQDLIELQRNMEYFEMGTLAKEPFEYLDVQKLFSIAYEDGKSRRNLEYAIDFLKIEKDVPFHRAYADAYYTTKVLQRIDSDIEEYCSYDVYTLPAEKDDEIHKIYSSYSKYISRIFPTKAAAMADKEVSSMGCYLCDRLTRRRIRYFTTGGRYFIGVSQCPKHGFIKNKVRLRKHVKSENESEEVYVDKTQRLISKPELTEIMKKRDKALAMQQKRLNITGLSASKLTRQRKSGVKHEKTKPEKKK
ncbi:MAG: exonuclease domain-containing protein [Lachnospiraceae bacterium]|nr:exonuclease domain-containing protein [Lachnospiraceae bacterium]